MGEEAGRDPLEDEQRGAGEHQHVEDEPRRGGTLAGLDQQRTGVQEGLLAEHDEEDRRGEGAAAACGFGFGRAAGGRSRVRAGGSLSAAPERERDHAEREQRRGDHPGRDRVAPGGDPHRDRERERHARERLGDQQPREQPEPALPREVAAGEEACREGEHGGEVDPVQRLGTGEQVIGERRAQGQGDDREAERDQPLDPGRLAQGGADRRSADPVGRDRAGDELLDRPVQDGDGDEGRRPQDDDLPVGGRVEVVRREREVDVGEQAREADPDRQGPGRAPEAARLGLVGHRRHGTVAAPRARWSDR